MVRRRNGQFYATHCVKLIADSGKPFNIRYTVRTCIRDEESQTSYSGLTATSHCGWIKLAWINKNKRFKGCIHSCDKDGCIQLLN
ncbi:unnamed protein product [Didymodactylos carnosus]|uniref:Uncharacterized protein n=1 Tax=Didymodactylos carnosus TaxID=1234261 RepID=A0A8S2FP90_9BILA|nr:unnamed protein product [Didymodactylos carnosus]CAF4314523.1 unnamed protein product [Didymodactylos carnosus]